MWKYVGGYESKVIGEFRGSTFKGLPEDVKRAWGKLLAASKSRKQDVYVSLRARVALRKSGIAVDPEAEQLEMAEIRAGRGYALHGNDIVEALSSGEEVGSLPRLAVLIHVANFNVVLGHQNT